MSEKFSSGRINPIETKKKTTTKVLKKNIKNNKNNLNQYNNLPLEDLDNFSLTNTIIETKSTVGKGRR